MVNTTEVKPSQIWADNDPRSTGRTLRVEHITVTGKAFCTILTNSDETQREVDHGTQRATGYRPKDMRGRTTFIKLSRFKPTSTGYRLIGQET